MNFVSAALRAIDNKIDWKIVGKFPLIPVILIVCLFGWLGLGKMVLGLIFVAIGFKLVELVGTLLVLSLPSEMVNRMINQLGRFLDAYQSRTDPLAFEARKKEEARDREFERQFA